MAYGELGKDMNDEKPRRRRVTPQQTREEPEVDRFDEGKTIIWKFVLLKNKINKLMNTTLF